MGARYYLLNVGKATTSSKNRLRRSQLLQRLLNEEEIWPLSQWLKNCLLSEITRKCRAANSHKMSVICISHHSEDEKLPRPPSLCTWSTYKQTAGQTFFPPKCCRKETQFSSRLFHSNITETCKIGKQSRKTTKKVWTAKTNSRRLQHRVEQCGR